VPSALWSVDARAHRAWRLKEAKADDADRRGQTFQYVHAVIGPFMYHPNDYLSRRIFLYDDFERAELQFAIEQARQGGTIVDVGANIGLYTAACGTAAGGRGHVLALEPGPSTFTKLAETCRMLGLRNVTMLQAAAGKTDGSGVLVTDPDAPDVHQHLADARAHTPANSIVVDTRRLDDLVDPSSVTLLKIDVEGHEVDVLEGAPRILANGKAHLIVEFFPDALAASGTSPEELWQSISRTHRCAGVTREDGTMLPPPGEGVSGIDGQIWNTMWQPR
jgi:FkbM family methyltransferase